MVVNDTKTYQKINKKKNKLAEYRKKYYKMMTNASL